MEIDFSLRMIKTGIAWLNRGWLKFLAGQALVIAALYSLSVGVCHIDGVRDGLAWLLPQASKSPWLLAVFLALVLAGMVIPILIKLHIDEIRKVPRPSNSPLLSVW